MGMHQWYLTHENGATMGFDGDQMEIVDDFRCVIPSAMDVFDRKVIDGAEDMTFKGGI